MKLLTSRLPSTGFACAIDIVELKPLNYGELIKYSDHTNSDEVSDLLWDMENLILTIPNWEQLSSFDVLALISYRKMMTITQKKSITLLTGKVLSIDDVRFGDIDKKLITLNTVKLSAKLYKPSIKSMKDFYSTVIKFQGNKVKSLHITALASFLGITDPKVVTNFHNEDIKLCEQLYPLILSQPCISIEGGEEVLMVGKASELFHNVCSLSQIDEDSLRFSETV